MKQDELRAVLDAHAQWLQGNGGNRADLTGADLTGADLIHADLTGAYLTGAKLMGADLIHADLTGADMRSANLLSADMRHANMRNADLRGAVLLNAKLQNAGLMRAKLCEATMPWSAVHAGGETMTGSAGDYWWCAHRATDGVWLSYGCEKHPLSWWRTQGPDLSVKHGHAPKHWQKVAAVIALASTLGPETVEGEE